MKDGFYKKTLDLHKFHKAAKQNGVLYLMMALFLAGLISTTVLFASDKMSTAYSIMPADNSYLHLLLNLLSLHLLLLLAVLFAAFCGIGMPFVLLICLLKGAIAGCIGTGLVRLYGMEGFQLACFLYAPGEAICSLGIITACVQSFYMSMDVTNLLFRKNGVTINIRTYLQKYVLLFGFTLFGCCWVAVAFRLFAGLILT